MKKTKQFYIGQNDPFLDFQSEGKNFVTIGQCDMQFIVNIRNNNPTETRRVLLIPGWDFNPIGTRIISSDETAILAPKAGVLSEKALAANLLDLDKKADLIVSGAPKYLDDLYNWLNENPTTLGAVRVSSTHPEQVMQTITYRQLSPFKDLETSYIKLGTGQTEDTYRDKLVTISTPGMVLSKLTQLEMVIIPNSTCVITFFFGGSLSTTNLMQSKVNEAIRCINSFPIQRKMYGAISLKWLREFFTKRIRDNSIKNKAFQDQINELKAEIIKLNDTISELKSEK